VQGQTISGLIEQYPIADVDAFGCQAVSDETKKRRRRLEERRRKSPNLRKQPQVGVEVDQLVA
jgi:hypothetical protein